MNSKNFNLKLECDFCNTKENTARTNYGTSNYIRLICKKCFNRATMLNGKEPTLLD